MSKEGRHIHLTGIVQGVGFRPFVYGLATDLHLTGWVRNASSGVEIEVEGTPGDLSRFVQALPEQAPALAQIDTLEVQERPSNGFTLFEIKSSKAEPTAFQPISPDVTLCPDCAAELRDPTDRRYRYPFINCTNCGPRFTIIKDIPYDRPLTTMADFPLCPACASEYHDPTDRRFHAQPVACPACGPQVWLEDKQGQRLADRDEALREAQRQLQQGAIVAVKGLGGFHLACDGFAETAVARLRQRKLRRAKPFALMMADLATVAQHCYLNAAEIDLLCSRARPIVILRRRPQSTIAPSVAPGQNSLGVMLPYTPLHQLLFEPAPEDDPAAGRLKVLVMTSGNLSEEPIAHRNDEARQQLAPLADLLLLHDRPIHIRCDDSVMQVVGAQPPTPLRRSRGYAPFPVQLAEAPPPILGLGAELKNTFCLSNGRYAFLSHHIGDMANYETLQSFRQGVAHFEQLFRVNLAYLAHDLHPDYLTTRLALEWAEARGLPTIATQHHHAHIAAGMAEHRLPGDRPLIGVAFDGTGYGPDGTIWGGEFLVADYGGYERPFHLKPFPLPGGEQAIKEPWRVALACLHQAGLPWDENLPPVRQAQARPHGVPLSQVLQHQLQQRLNAPLTSSMGRLFDAVAALIGVRQTVTYEAQAAIELEALVVAGEDGRYPLAYTADQIDPAPLLAAISQAVQQGVAPALIATRFHNSLVQMVVEICGRISADYQLNEILLSGGVWQNRSLLARAVPRLQEAGFTVYTHQKVPPNDGGLALGQVAIAAQRIASGTL